MQGVGSIANEVLGRPEIGMDPEVAAAQEAKRAAWRAQAVRDRDQKAIGWLRAAGAPQALEARPAFVPFDLMTWAHSWGLGKPPRGAALLAGPVGVGKSMATQWAIASQRLSPKPLPARRAETTEPAGRPSAPAASSAPPSEYPDTRPVLEPARRARRPG